MKRWLALMLLALTACATWQAPPGVDIATLRAGAVTETARDVRVSADLLDAAASEAMFGSRIDQAEVQPVWLEIENRSTQPLWLLRTGADPDYYSPLEVAWAMHRSFSGSYNAQVDDHVASLAFANPIMPGATNSGVVFMKPQTGTVLLNLDLFGNATFVPFSLFLWRDDQNAKAPAPLAFRYPESAIVDYDDPAAFRQAIARLPSPLNLIFVGALPDIAAATVRRNYRRDKRDDDVQQHIFEREPDNVLRKKAQAGSPATWIRVWAAPMRYEGKAVFVAQVGRPVGGRFTKTGTHATHGDIDEARNLVVQDMMYSGGLEKLGFASGAGANAQTDGLRAVLFFATRPRSLADVELLDWEPYLERRDAQH